MTFEQFLKLCNMCWNEKHGFLVIDKESNINKGRYRKKFNYYVSL